MLSGANTLESVIFKKMKLKQANQEIGMYQCYVGFKTAGWSFR